MDVLFWMKRFLWVFCIAFTLIFCTHLLRDHALKNSLSESLVWAMISANIFISSRIYQSRKGIHCTLCPENPKIYNSR
jgi:hypothetical protein